MKSLLSTAAKEVFLLAFWTKIRKKQTFSGYQTIDQPSVSHVFLFSGRKKRSKMVVYFSRFFMLQRTTKKDGMGDLNSEAHKKICESVNFDALIT